MQRADVRVNGKILTFVSEIRYLGVRISKRMGFDVHAKGLYRRVVNALSGLRRVMRREWGLRGRTIRTIYKGLLTACDVWCGCVA